MEHDLKFSNAKEAVASALLDLEIKKEEYVQVRSSERKKNNGNPGESIPASSESLVAAKSAYEKAKQAVEAAKLAATTEGTKAFKLYGNLLSDEARQPWEKIAQTQTTNVRGKTSMKSLMMKLLPKPGTPSWSASRSTYSRCSDMTRTKPSNTISQIC
jgi:hypothetical protein